MKNLEMNFETSNSCLRSFNKIFCSWGQRKTPYDVNKQIKGQTAPLWANPSPNWFLTFFILNLLCSLLFISSFIAIRFTKQGTTSCLTEEVKKEFTIAFIVLGSIILFANSFYWLFLFIKEYANDQEWSRYLSFMVVLDLGLIAIVIVDFIFSSNMIVKKSIPTGDCNTITYVMVVINFLVSIFCAVISVMMLVKSILIAKDFFLHKYVPHTAICEDEDIIIME